MQQNHFVHNMVEGLKQQTVKYQVIVIAIVIEIVLVLDP